MNLLKSLFVSLYLMVVAVLFTKSVSEITFEGPDFGWIGSSLSGGVVLAYFGWLYLGKPARTSLNLWGFSGLVFLGFLVTLLSGIFQSKSFITFIFSAIIFVGWLGYLYWYSFFTERPLSSLQPDSQIPEFTAKNEKGETVSSDDLKGTPTLLLFFRGNWCPLCMAHINEVARSYQSITQNGTKIYLVSPQPPKHTKKLAKRYKVPFHFIVDEEFRLTRLFNLYHSNGTPFGFQVFGFDSDTIYPMVVIADANNKVIYSDQTDNYRLRPEPADFLKILGNLNLTTS